MKTQGRGDTGGRIPPPQDDYDDYDDAELSAQDDLEANGLVADYEDEPVEAPAPAAHAGGRSGPNGNTGSGRPSSPQDGNGSRMRPPAGATRPASSLPKRRPRPGATQTEVEIEAPPAVAPAGRLAGNGKRRGPNGMAATAAVAAPTATTAPPPRSALRTPQSNIAVEAPPEPETLATRFSRFVVNYETLIYMTIFVVALITRFWDLGNRGIHHDESLHAVFSRNLYIGTGYTHDPMMHGPLQFNVIALMYWLFGTTDATARFASVFCGIFVVMCPLFLRRQMGRWPALIASFLLLVSPGVLYFSRMAREDAIFSAMEMLMIVGLWRFISMRKPADFFIFCAGLSLMFTIKESAYLTVAVLGVMFALLFAFQAGYAVLGAFLAYGAAMGVTYLTINGQIKSGQVGALPDIPAQNPDYGTITNFATNLIGHPLIQWALIITLLFIGVLVYLLWSQRRKVAMMEAAYDYEDEVPVRPMRPTRPASRAPQGALPTRRPRLAAAVAEEATVASTQVVADGRETETAGSGEGAIPAAPARMPAYVEVEPDYEATEVWSPNRLDPKPGTLLAHYQPGSIPHLIGALFGKPSVLLIGFLIAATIFVVFYSVFFTDLPRGIASGLFASLGYWMAQQEVERGGQPWYYYFLIIPLYQPIAVFFSLVATTFFSIKGIRGLLRKREERRYGDTDEPGLSAFNLDRPVPFAKFSVFLPLFMIWWLAGEVAIYSWAGEKMPWLIVHMIRPAIFLAALFLGALVASILARRHERLAWAREYDSYYDEEVGAPTTPLPAAERRTTDYRRPAGGRGQAGRIPPPPTANPKYARRAPVVLREQEPPWLAWNRPGSKFPAISFLTIFTLLALAWGLKLNSLVFSSNTAGFGVAWIYPALAAILVVSYAVWLGPARVFRYVAVALFSIFFLYELRSGINLTYQHPDVPTDMAVYVQTSPDVTRSVKEITDYSNYATGGLNLKVVYDSFASWPYEWYFRDFKSKSFIGAGEPPVGPDHPVLVLEYAKHNNDPKLAEYLSQRYAMRWWFPEDWYKRDFIQGKDFKNTPFSEQLGAAFGTTFGTITNPQMSSTLWKYLMFRETPMPLGSEDMIVFVRRDIAQTYHYLQYEPPNTTDEPSITVRTPPTP